MRGGLICEVGGRWLPFGRWPLAVAGWPLAVLFGDCPVGTRRCERTVSSAEAIGLNQPETQSPHYCPQLAVSGFGGRCLLLPEKSEFPLGAASGAPSDYRRTAHCQPLTANRQPYLFSARILRISPTILSVAASFSLS